MSSRDGVKCVKQSIECLHCCHSCKKDQNTYGVLSVHKKYDRWKRSTRDRGEEDDAGLFINSEVLCPLNKP